MEINYIYNSETTAYTTNAQNGIWYMTSSY